MRDLIAHRQRLTRTHTMAANRLQSFLHRYHFVPPAGELFRESQQRHGLTRRQFVRFHLMQLGLGNDLTHIQRGGTKRPLAPVDEAFKLRPELQANA